MDSTINNDAIATIAVSTVRAVSINKGFVQIEARTRMGKDKKEIPANQKLRAIIIPEFQPNVSSKYVRIVCEALEATAKSQLEAQWTEQPSIKEVQAAAYTEDALLLWAAREAESKKLSVDSITAFWNQSQLKEEFSKTYSEKQLTRFVASLTNIAAPILSADYYNEDKALKRIVTLGTYERDVENETCQQMIRKLQAYVDRSIKMRADIGDVAEIDG